MNFILKPPLEHIALVKVAAVLWNHHDIRTLVLEFLNSPLFLQLEKCTTSSTTLPRREKWQAIEDKVKEKLPRLIIPVSLKVKLLDYIQAVGLQILKWLEYHLRYSRLCLNVCLELNLPIEFCWTPQGTIDKKKTAEVLIKDKQLDITTRYKLACMYCLEDNIPELWNKLLQSKKEFFPNKEDAHKDLEQDLVVFGGFYVQGKVPKLDNAMRCFGSTYSVSKANKVAFEHFLKNKILIEQSLIKIAVNVLKAKPDIYSTFLEPPKEYYTEIFFLLFSQMKHEQQIKLFQSHSEYILICLLDWPWQNFFIEAAAHLQIFLSEKCYYCICAIMLFKIKLGFKDYNYLKMFRDFWQQIPRDHKRSFMSNNSFLNMLCYLFQMIKDKMIIKSTIQDVPPAEKQNFLYSDTIRTWLEQMMYANEWENLKFFFRLCISSKDEKITFIQIFKKFVQKRCSEGDRKFIQILPSLK